MARRSGSTISQEELYPAEEQFAREEVNEARLLDLDAEQESPFLRGQKRVSARRGSLPKKAAARLKWITIALFAAGLTGIAAAALYSYGEHSWRFRINSSDDIEVTGTQNVSRGQVIEVMGGDIGRNIFFVPLTQRQAELEQIPWVESASVMRFVPNHIRVEIHERTPVAFARIGSRIMLTDAVGTLMDLPSAGKAKYSFPVILGVNPGEPSSTRSARMKIYDELVRELDSGGARYSQDLSEVDLTDPDDVKVLAADPSGEVLIHLGSSNFLDRYKVYVTHVQEWRQQFDKLESVDLRYDRQIIVNPDLHGAARQPALSTAAMKSARAAGVKPAALITHQIAPPAPKPAVPVGVPPSAKTAEKPSKKTVKVHHKRKPRREIVRTKGDVTVKTMLATPATPQNPPPASTPKPSSDSTKPSAKPSPAIPKGQDHP